MRRIAVVFDVRQFGHVHAARDREFLSDVASQR